MMRLFIVASVLACGVGRADDAATLASAPTQARAADGAYISWREHLIDGETVNGTMLRGSDGLALADLDGDGYEDIVSVHESDDQYDGVPEGHLRVAFGSANPDQWVIATLAEGPEAGAAEDVAIADLNGDGWLDVVAACELSHLIYLQNPGGRAARTTRWQRLIPTVTTKRGSFIRVFLADLDRDGTPEIISPNKGAQDPTQARQEPKEISFFALEGPPLADASWTEHVLTRVPWPINSYAVDLDSDGDTDVVGGSVAQGRMLWFENVSREGAFDFVEHAIEVAVARGSSSNEDQAPTVNGFHVQFVDLNDDERLDIVTFDTRQLLGLGPVWLEQPAAPGSLWLLHRIGSYAPDTLVGLSIADINGDGRPDLMTGGYSLGSRTEDGVAKTSDALGRLAWYENGGERETEWVRHDFSRRERGMFDMFVARDMDRDGDVDFATTRGNSGPYDGVLWLEQVRSAVPTAAFERGRREDSPEIPLP